MTGATDMSPAQACAMQPRSDLQRAVSALSEADCRALLHDWTFWARPKQRPPAGDWFVWLVLAGRGFGKTRMGAEWVRARISGRTPLSAPANAPEHIALIGETAADAREVMVEGESGLIGVCPPDRRPVYESSRRRLSWPNGAIAHLYAASEPDQLRGPQHHAAWADEIAKWPDGAACWSNIVLGLRLGPKPQLLATTTPRPLQWLMALAKDRATVVTHGRTRENAGHLSPNFLRQVERLYGKTRLGRQELDGAFLDDTPGALWTRNIIEASRCSAVPTLARVVVAVDPPASHGEGAANCGIVVAGRAEDGRLYVLADHTCQGLRPEQWARRVIAAASGHSADRVVAEINNGGDLVEAVLRQVDAMLPYRAVRASRGKIVRAEPVAALYERGMVGHVGRFDELEDEMCRYCGGRSEASPDRLDALVWALTDLALDGGGDPRLVML